MVAVEVLQLGQLEGVKTRLRAMERVTEIPYPYFQLDGSSFWSVETRPTDVFKLSPRCSGSHPLRVDETQFGRSKARGSAPRENASSFLLLHPPSDWNKMSPVAAQTRTVDAESSTEPCGARRMR